MSSAVGMPVWATEIFKIRTRKDTFYKEVNSLFSMVFLPLTGVCMWIVGLMLSDISDEGFKKIFDLRVEKKPCEEYDPWETSKNIKRVTKDVMKYDYEGLWFELNELVFFIELLYWYDIIHDAEDKPNIDVDQYLDLIIKLRHDVRSSEKMLHKIVFMILVYGGAVESCEPVKY